MRVLLDMNIYANLERGASEEHLIATLVAHGLRAVRSAELIQEATRLSDPSARRRRIRAISRIAEQAVPPCKFAEADELRAQLRVHRPTWLRLAPARAKIVQLKRTWDKWLNRGGNEVQLESLRRLHQEEVDKNKTIHRELRHAVTLPEAVIHPNVECSDSALQSEVLAGAPEPTPYTQLRSDPERFMQWAKWRAREQLFADYRTAMIDREYRMLDLVDHLGPYLTRAAFRSLLDWARFCFVDVDVERLPRWMLFGGVLLGQQLSQYQSGNAGDLAHTSYLRDVDVFLTSDAGFVANLERLPRSLVHASVGRVRPDHADLDAVLGRRTAG